MGIQDKAVLVDLKINMWSGVATDHKISEEISITKTGSTNSGKYLKKLLPANEQLKQIQALATQIRKEFQAATLEWEGSTRLMPIEKLDDWMKTYYACQQEWDDVITRFVDAYPESINKAQLALADLFNISDYPLPTNIHKSFGLTQKIKAVPTDDFRFETDSATIKQLQEEAEANANKNQEKAIRAFLEKLLLDVNRITKATDPSTQRTRNSLFSTLENTLNNAKAFNFNNNPEIDSLITEGLELLEGTSKGISKEQKPIINKKAGNLMQRIQSYGKPISGT